MGELSSVGIVNGNLLGPKLLRPDRLAVWSGTDVGEGASIHEAWAHLTQRKHQGAGQREKVEVVLFSERDAKWFLGRVGLVQAVGVCDEALLAVAALAHSLFVLVKFLKVSTVEAAAPL